MFPRPAYRARRAGRKRLCKHACLLAQECTFLIPEAGVQPFTLLLRRHKRGLAFPVGFRRRTRGVVLPCQPAKRIQMRGGLGLSGARLFEKHRCVLPFFPPPLQGRTALRRLFLLGFGF